MLFSIWKGAGIGKQNDGVFVCELDGFQGTLSVHISESSHSDGYARPVAWPSK